MSNATDSPICSVPGCNTQAAHGLACDTGDRLCDSHYRMSSISLRERFQQLNKRVQLLEAYWNDEARYDAVVASDRYLKLANATGWANELAEDAWNRLKLDITIQVAARNGAEQNGRQDDRKVS